MTTGEILNLSALLAPIPGDQQLAWEDTRYDIYHKIEQARKEDDNLPTSPDPNKPLWSPQQRKTANWVAVIDLASAALANDKKDLKVATWLVDALIKRHGFVGLRDGSILLRGLVENFWDELYPQSIDARRNQFEWMNANIPILIKLLSLTAGDDSYSLYHWQEARDIDNLGLKDPAAMKKAVEQEKKIDGKKFGKAVLSTPRPFYEDCFRVLTESKFELGKLEAITDEKFGKEAPSLIEVRNALDDCHALVSEIVTQKRKADPNYKPETFDPVGPNPAVTQPLTAASAVVASNGSGELSATWSSEPKSREEAFQRLSIIAAYLRRAEPQSPVSYLLDRCVRWTQMPLEQWLGEVIQNQDTLKQLREMLGIKEQKSP